MKTVHKHPVNVNHKKFSLMLQEEFKFLRVHFQREGELQLWVECVPEKSKSQVDFEFFGTGHEIPDSAKHLATFDSGPFVMHLYQMN